MTKLQNERGSILLAAFAILALLVIVMTALIAYGSWHKARCQLVLNRVKATYLAEAGIQHALAELRENADRWTSTLSIRVDTVGSFTYSTRPWGGYLLIESKGVSGRTEERLQATIGQVAPTIFTSTLSLIGPPYPLVVAGNTRIDGDVQVGPAGVSKGELHGQSYRGDSLVYGDIRTLESQQVPQFRDDLILEFLNNLRKMKQDCRNGTDLSLIIRSPETATGADVESRKTSASIVIDVSDTTPVRQPQYLFADGSITVTGQSHVQHQVLRSASSITVKEGACLSDCILIAPSIAITDRADVSGQLFADSLVVVEGEAKLSDMALVYLVGHPVNDEWTGTINIESNRTSEACLVFHGNAHVDGMVSQQIKQTGRVRIARASKVNGIIWTEGYLEMLGTMNGSVAANLLYYYESPTLYLDWLVNASIGPARDNGQRVLPLIFGQRPVYEFKRVGPGV